MIGDVPSSASKADNVVLAFLKAGGKLKWLATIELRGMENIDWRLEWRGIDIIE